MPIAERGLHWDHGRIQRKFGHAHVLVGMFSKVFEEAAEISDLDNGLDVSLKGVTQIAARLLKRGAGHSNRQMFDHGVPNVVFLPQSAKDWDIYRFSHDASITGWTEDVPLMKHAETVWAGRLVQPKPGTPLPEPPFLKPGGGGHVEICS